MTKYKMKNNADRVFKFDTLTVVVTNERSSMYAKTHTALQAPKCSEQDLTELVLAQMKVFVL